MSSSAMADEETNGIELLGENYPAWKGKYNYYS